MTHPDLLTDADIATRHEPKRGWFNQFVAIKDNTDVVCSLCQRVLAQNKGDVLFSCCPAIYPTYEEAIADTEEECRISGEQLVSYMGTFEL